MGTRDSAGISTGTSAGIPSPLYGGGIFVSSKPFQTLDEQIGILKGRDMIIQDIEKAKRFLLSNNYYNIINGYSKFFPRKSEKYINGTTFNEVTQLYLFDIKIKEAFFQAILAAESHLKAIFAYRFAEAFHDIPYAYLNISCYDPRKTLSVVSTISKLSGIINYQKNNRESSIYHYIHEYHHVPIWVLVNYLDFGELRHMLDSSQERIQNKVAKDISEFVQQNIQSATTFTPEVMLAFISNINEVRNVCAHNNRLLGFHCRRDDKYWAPLHNPYSITPNDERRDAYSVFLSLQCFLSKKEFQILHNTLRKRMNYLRNQLNSIDINQILSLLGFPDDWNTTVSKIKQ